MDQNDDASKYLQQAFGASSDGLTLTVLTGTQAAAEINVLHNRVWRDVRKPPPTTTPEDEVLATKAFAALVENPHGNWSDISNATRTALAEFLLRATVEADLAGEAPFMALPPGLAREHWPVAATLRSIERRESRASLRTAAAP